MNSEFLGMPPYVWNLIFDISKYLIITVIFGVLLTIYQRKREEEIHVKGILLHQRLLAYQRINMQISKIYSDVYLSNYQIKDILPPIEQFTGIKQTCYCKFFESEESFDNYYNDLSLIIKEESLFLDPTVKQYFSRVISLLTNIYKMLAAVHDVEHSSYTNKTPKQINETISNSYHAIGIIVHDDMFRIYTETDILLSNQMHRMKLTYRFSFFKRMLIKIKERVYCSIDEKLLSFSKMNFIEELVFKSIIKDASCRSQIVSNPQGIISTLGYIHHIDTIKQLTKNNKDFVSKLTCLLNEYMRNFSKCI
jgi:hypothetical protein